MKKINLLIMSTGVVLLSFISACKDAPDHSDETPSNTSGLDFTKYMAIGNSITAGYQSGALYQEGQEVAYPVLIAKSAGATDFQIPTLSGEGTGERLTWNGNFTASGSPDLVKIPKATSGEIVQRAVNLTLERPYNNMGIPGAFLVLPSPFSPATDFFDVKMDGNISAGGEAKISGAFSRTLVGGNGLFTLTLRSLGSSLWLSMKSYQPKVVSLWLGNNDVLGYATSGGTAPLAPSDAAVFQTKYQQVADSISGLASQPKVVVATIPDVTTIPFFTTVNVSLVGKIPSGKIYYNNSGGSVDSIYVDAATYASGAIYNRGMITLLGASALGNGVTTFTGLAKALPLGSQYVLDPAEIVIAKTAVQQFNNSIKTIAAAKGWAIADVSTEFGKIALTGSTGKQFQGKTVTVAFITGGLFSYDGVHPSTLGQGIIANFVIDALNSKYGSSIRNIDLNSLAGMKFGKTAPSGIAIDPASIPAEPLENMVNMLGGSLK